MSTMGYPRCHLVDPTVSGAYHCVSRCVRRAWLCGQDELTGRSFEHRRQWVEDRIHLLAGSFAVGVYAYAVMSNHVHLVLYVQPAAVKGWSEAEVIERWCRVFPVRSATVSSNDTTGDPADSGSKVSPQTIATWRERLGSLSWFMRALAEPIARRANAEDDCSGRFWEGRFRCQALLDERSILGAMAYVDLNPVRAGMTATLEGSTHTSIVRRLVELVQSASQPPIPATETPPAPTPRPPRLQPVAGLKSDHLFDVTALQYLDLVAWTGSVPRAGNAPLADPDPAAALKALGCTPAEWQEQLQLMRSGSRAIGGSEQMRALAERLRQHWVRRWGRRTGPSAGQAARGG